MKFEVYEDKSGEWRWRLVAANGQIIATAGEGYVEKYDCVNGIKLVSEGSPSAPIIVV